MEHKSAQFAFEIKNQIAGDGYLGTTYKNIKIVLQLWSYFCQKQYLFIFFAFNCFKHQGAHWSCQNNQTPNLPVTDPLLYKNKVVLIKPLFIITIGFSLQPGLYYKKYSASVFI